MTGRGDDPRVTRRTLLAFCAPSLPVAAMGLPLIVYLPPYFASHIGLSVATVGLIFFFVRFADVCLDPFIGQAMDRTDTRIGRFRPWLLAGSLVLATGAWGMFMARPGMSVAATALWLFVLYVGFSMTYLSHTAWGGTLSDDYGERARVFGWWQAANVVGMILVLMLPPLAFRLTGDPGPAVGIQAMGWFVVILLPVTAIIMALGVRERAAATRSQQASIRDMAGMAASPLMRRLLVADLLLCIAPGITGALFQFLFISVMGFNAAQSGLLLLCYFAAGLAATPIWVRLAGRIGKHRAISIAAIWFAVTNVGLLMLPSGNFTLAAAAMLIAGAPYSAAPFLLRAILADVCEAERLRTGTDRTGLGYAILTATTKIAYGIPVGVMYPVLGIIGFEAALGARNSDGALLGLELLFTLPTLVIALGGAWIMWRWPLDAAEHARIRAELELVAATDRPVVG